MGRRMRQGYAAPTVLRSFGFRRIRVLAPPILDRLHFPSHDVVMELVNGNPDFTKGVVDREDLDCGVLRSLNQNRDRIIAYVSKSTGSM